MTDALIRPDGTMRTFDEFRIQTAIITGKQLRHLKTEYQTAVAGAQMASHWEQIQRNKKSYPYLQFIAIEDDHTSALCRSLDGVIRLVDDPFWMQFYPPNHYNCRSRVKQLRKGEETPEDSINKPNIPAIFKVNLGQRGLAFPEDHAYFEAMPREVYQEARRFFPYTMQFDILDTPDDYLGLVRQHYLVNQSSSDYQRLYMIAIEKAKEHKIIVDIMPTLDPNKTEVQRRIIFPDAKVGKSPDLRIDKVLWEEESIDIGSALSQYNISRKLSKGIKQATHVIINMNEDVPIDILRRVKDGKFTISESLQEIEFRMPTNIVRYKKQKPID